jgi:hypothetical protein
VAHDVFISYSTTDANAAVAICDRLESEGFMVWMAPRDVTAGRKWSEAIIDALDAAKIMVLVLSAASNDSEQVEREVELAANRRLPIVPIIVQSCMLSKSLQYYISVPHRLDAFNPPLEQHLGKLVDAVRKNMGRGESAAARTAAPAIARGPAASSATAGPNSPAIPVGGAARASVAAKLGSPSSGRAATGAAVAPAAPAPVAPTGIKLCLLYKRGAPADERVLKLLETHLTSLGHSVFIDRHLTIGVAWAQEIEKQIRESDAAIPLLSAASITSEMLSYEIQVAHAAGRQESGKPRLLPVRVAFDDPLPHEIAGALERLQYFLWKCPEDDQRLVEQVAAAISAPPRKIVDSNKLEAAGGAVQLQSDFYIVRPTDGEFLSSVLRGDAIVLIKGARQMGKTSLLARGLQQAREKGAKAAFTDFQKLNNDHLASAENFYIVLGELLADQLDLDIHPRDKWDPRRSPNVNFDRFIRREILKTVESHLVWGLDEVDRLFTCDFGGEVFALFRTWHNERALDPAGPWAKLTLVIAYATEAHLFITDVNQSPFNVGTRLTLQDFTLEQMADLNGRHGSPLGDGRGVARLQQLIGGHPFLARRSFYELATRGLTLDEFEAAATAEDGPFGDHLRRMLIMLAKDPELMEAMRGVLRGECCPNPESFYRLRSAGVIGGTSARDVEPRCDLYTVYLRKHLL